jgi:hypothetical protein
MPCNSRQSTHSARHSAKFWTNASLAKLGFGTALYRQLGCHSLSFAKSRFNYCRVSLNNSPSAWKRRLWVYHAATGIHGENTSTLQIECQFNFIFWSQTWPSNDDQQTLSPQLRHFCSFYSTLDEGHSHQNIAPNVVWTTTSVILMETRYWCTAVMQLYVTLLHY